MEYIFRGKGIDDNIWHYGALYHSTVSNTYYICMTLGTFIQVSPETIGQYVGATDKEGNLMYEGDIVLSISNKKLYLVCQSDKKCSFVVESLENPFSIKNITKDDEMKRQNRIIVGNKYDNPELEVNIFS